MTLRVSQVQVDMLQAQLALLYRDAQDYARRLGARDLDETEAALLTLEHRRRAVGRAQEEIMRRWDVEIGEEGTWP